MQKLETEKVIEITDIAYKISLQEKGKIHVYLNF
jgi:hypothetical protein